MEDLIAWCIQLEGLGEILLKYIDSVWLMRVKGGSCAVSDVKL
jgi:hypothetical protein